VTESKGKVILQLEMDATDVERLVNAFKAGKLAELGIVDIQFPNQADSVTHSDVESRGSRHRRAKQDSKPRNR